MKQTMLEQPIDNISIIANFQPIAKQSNQSSLMLLDILSINSGNN